MTVEILAFGQKRYL